jgi:spore germination protein KA
MGTSISIVGALVLGDAAVNAGIVSPIVVIVVAISSITGLLFTDTDIINALRFWKFFILLFSATMGLVGFIVASLILITNLCSIEVIGLPYLIPFSPLNINALKDSLFMVSRNKMKKRANYLTNNIIRIGDKNEK